MPKPISHIAVIRLSAMGDVAMTVPVLLAFAKQHPTVKITVVSRPFFKPFFDGIANVSFFGVDLKERHKGVFGLYRLFFDLKQLKVDAVADFHNVLRSKVVRTLFAISGNPIASIDKGRSEKKALTKISNKIIRPLKSTTERYADVLRRLGFAINLSQSGVRAKHAISETVAKTSGHKVDKWIGIAPFAAHQCKQYPIDLMREVVSKLSKNPRVKLFLFGAGKSEVAVLESLAENQTNIVVIAGKLSLSDELQIISNLDVMLSMDSGNAHIAAMFGVNTVTLWGATHPFAGFAPFAQPEANALVSDRTQYPFLPTSVYGNKIVPGYENAMRTISPDDVVRKINSLLS